MRSVYVAGIGITSFGRLEFPLAEIAAYPAMMAMRDSGLAEIDQVYVANMGGGRINHQTALASAVVDTLSLTPAGAESIENGPASGASALKQGFLAVASGEAFAEARLLEGSPALSDHKSLGEVSRFFVLGLFLSLIGLVVVGRRADALEPDAAERLSERGAINLRAVSGALVAATLAFAVLSTIWVVRAGHEGAKLHYKSSEVWDLSG